MDGQNFKVAFLDADGGLIDIVSIPASTVASAAQRAEEIATEIAAVNFFITSVPLIQDRTPPFSP